MVLRFSNVLPAVLMSAALFHPRMAFAQDGKPGTPSTSITVSVDGLACGAPAQNSFKASDFAIAVNTTSGPGGGGAGKTTFTDLAILKPSDSCSLPLLMLGARGQLVTRVVVTEGGQRAAVLTIVLENVQIVSSFLSGSSEETLNLSYSAVTVTDAAGHTTGRIVREPGSVPISPFAKEAPARQI